MDSALEVFIEQTNRSMDRMEKSFSEGLSKIEEKMFEIEVQVIGLKQWKWKVDGASILISIGFSAIIAIATVIVMVIKP